jgi:two-component system, OmpR family, KDP operon response regulator KdpE
MSCLQAAYAGPIDTKKRLLLVEDDTAIARPLVRALEREGFAVEHLEAGEPAIRRVDAEDIDLVVLDLTLPDLDGLDVCRQIRASHPELPIVMLTARREEVDVVVGFDAGADDYVAKPFGMDELLARVRAAVRRAAPGEETAVVTTDDFQVDLGAKRVLDHTGAPVRLTPTEWQLLEVLVRHAGKLVTQRQLLQEVWGPQYGDESNYLRVHIAHLRRKLEPDRSRPRYLITEPGMGYRFVAG